MSDKDSVDPDLLIAREAVAQCLEASDWPEWAADCRAGQSDDDYGVESALRALKLAREKGAL